MQSVTNWCATGGIKRMLLMENNQGRNSHFGCSQFAVIESGSGFCGAVTPNYLLFDREEK